MRFPRSVKVVNVSFLARVTNINISNFRWKNISAYKNKKEIVDISLIHYISEQSRMTVSLTWFEHDKQERKEHDQTKADSYKTLGRLAKLMPLSTSWRVGHGGVIARNFLLAFIFSCHLKVQFFPQETRRSVKNPRA